jgi:hypothetical protein
MASSMGKKSKFQLRETRYRLNSIKSMRGIKFGLLRAISVVERNPQFQK